MSNITYIHTERQILSCQSSVDFLDISNMTAHTSSGSVPEERKCVCMYVKYLCACLICAYIVDTDVYTHPYIFFDMMIHNKPDQETMRKGPQKIPWK